MGQTVIKDTVAMIPHHDTPPAVLTVVLLKTESCSCSLLCPHPCFLTLSELVVCHSNYLAYNLVLLIDI